MSNPENTNLGKLDVLISRLLADTYSGNLRIINTIHEKIHQGQITVYGHYDTNVANTNSMEVLFKANASLSAHSIINVNTDGDAEVQIFETPTISADGTPLTPRNKNRYASDTVGYTVFHTPTTSVDGTELINQFVAGGSGGIKVGAATEERDEWVFKEGLNYLIRVTNVSGVPAKINLVSSTYEA